MSEMPQLTPFDVVTQLIAAAVYLGVGGAALGQAPRDVRTRVFFGIALAHAVASSIPTMGWFLGVKSPLAYDRVPLGVMLAALSLGALLMFHFSQVFPRQRPWIRASGVQMPVAYVLIPAVMFLLVRWWPENPSQITPKFGLIFILFGFPLLVLLGLVLPIGSVVSFMRSIRDVSAGVVMDDRGAAPAQTDVRLPLAGILLSQVAGAALGILVVGPLEAVAPGSLAVAVVSLTVWLFALLTPVSFAAAVWKYGVLALPASPSAEVKAD